MSPLTLVYIAVIALATVIGLGWITTVHAQTDNNTNDNNNMTTYENKTLGIAFEYPTGWEVSDWDFSDEAEEELIVQPMLNNSDPKYTGYSGDEAFDADRKTELTIKILDNPEVLNPDTLQLESVSVQDFCTDLRASLSDETLETAGFSEPYAYWLTNEIGKDEITTVANQPACRIDSIELRDDVQEQFDINVYFQKDDKAYSLTFSADPTNVPTLAPIYQKMIDSFRFI